MSIGKHIRGCGSKKSQPGMVLFLSMMFLAIFASFGIAVLTLSSRNIRMADNHIKGNRALESAFSGMEVMNYWMNTVVIPRGTAIDQWYETMHADLVTNLADNNIAVDLDNPDNPMTLDSSLNKSFYVQLDEIVPDANCCLTVTGQAGGLQRAIAVNYEFGVREDTVFDFGIATKGPLQLSGNILLDGTNIAVEADVFIESENDDNVLSIIGNSQIAGDVKVTNPDAIVTLQGGQAGIGGETGQDAIDNHVEVGMPSPEFPVPNTTHFEQYATGDTIDSDTDVSSGGTYENVRITAGTNPIFSGDVTINGIMFIETPNVVIFSGGCVINGLIIGDGDMNDNSGDNQLMFLGNVGSSSVTELPEDSQFDGLREEEGTFLMAPGFSASFGGNFETLNGAIAANGIEFFGNAGGTIAGSVLNYSDTPMILSGNNDLIFNRSGATEIPAGFELEIILRHDASSYNEIGL